LRDLLPFSPAELEAIGALEGDYKLAIPPYYFSLIDPADPADPVRLQSVTSPLEAENPSGYELEDPLEEDKDMPVPGLTHRYPDRALIQTTHVCTMYCRFCTRKRARPRRPASARRCCAPACRSTTTRCCSRASTTTSPPCAG